MLDVELFLAILDMMTNLPFTRIQNPKNMDWNFFLAIKWENCFARIEKLPSRWSRPENAIVFQFLSFEYIYFM